MKNASAGWWLLLALPMALGMAASSAAGKAKREPVATIMSIPVPDAVYPAGEAINRYGDVLIQAPLKNRTQRAFLWRDGKLTELGTLGGDNTFARGLNDAGEVVGESATAAGELHAFFWRKGRMQDLGTLGGKGSGAWDINNHGQVVGRADTADGESHAFLSVRGAMRPLGNLNGRNSIATAINEEGQIVGSSLAADGRYRAVLWSDGKVRDLGLVAPYDSGTAFDINDLGQVVGVLGRGQGPHDHESAAFLYSAGKMTNLAALEGKGSTSFRIDRSGEVVGVSFNTKKGQQAFISKDGEAIALNTLLPPDTGWDLYWARDIDQGRIVGSGKFNGASHAYILTLNRR